MEGRAARAGAGVPAVASTIPACRGRQPAGRRVPAAHRGRGGSRLGPAPGPGWAHPTACAGRAAVSPSGSYRFYNLLERNGFASVEEVAAMPEACWFELRNCGTRFITAVRQVIAEL